MIRGALTFGLLAWCSTGAAAQSAVPPATPATPATRILTVCADPNNLPFSNKAEQGFENRIADLLARDLHAELTYVWWAQRRGYARTTLNAAACDLWPGVATGSAGLATSKPYYRSTYVFVTRRSAPLQGLTLDDPRLRSLKIGVQMIGSNAMNTPPAHSLSRRGIVDNVRGYMLYGNYETPNPPAVIMHAVENDTVDVALAWGPLAGYFARSSPVPLRLEAISPALDAGAFPMAYDISIGVRHDSPALVAAIDTVLKNEQPAIAAILAAYAVPMVPSLPN